VGSETMRRFNESDLHDSRMCGVEFRQTEEGVVVSLLLDRIQHGGTGYSEATLVFVACRFVGLELDCLGMRFTGGDIAASYCRDRSALLDSLAQPGAAFRGMPIDPGEMDGLLHFRVELIAPGGAIDIVARGCSWEGRGSEGSETADQ